MFEWDLSKYARSGLMGNRGNAISSGSPKKLQRKIGGLVGITKSDLLPKSANAISRGLIQNDENR